MSVPQDDCVVRCYVLICNSLCFGSELARDCYWSQSELSMLGCYTAVLFLLFTTFAAIPTLSLSCMPAQGAQPAGHSVPTSGREEKGR